MAQVETFPDRRDTPAEDICGRVDSARAVGVGRRKVRIADRLTGSGLTWNQVVRTEDYTPLGKTFY